MSEKDLDAIILETQKVLGKYVKKPPLTEKLLKKPPFRFLMDVFSNFIKQTGKFDGLYTPEEQMFENITSREDKMRFLQKMIDAIKLTTKLDLKVRTSKIVAGQEPELTNELLQAMASLAERKWEKEWDSIVDQVVISHCKTPLTLAKPPKETKNPSKNPSPAGKDEDPKRRKEKRISPQEQKLRKANEQASRSTPPSEKDKASQKKSKAPKEDTKLSRQNSKQKSPSPVKPKTKAKLQPSIESDHPSLSMSPVEGAPSSKPPATESAPTKPESETVTPLQEKEAVVAPVQESPSAPPAEPESRKSSSKSRRSSGSHRQPEPNPAPNENPSQPVNPVQPSENSSPPETNSSEVKREVPLSRENSKEANQRPRTSLRPPSARPASARPGAPRRRNVEIVLQPNDQIKMSGINVKLETFGDLDDDGENLVIIEDSASHDIVEGGGEEAALEGQLDAQGRLVQQILETQKELVNQSAEVEAPQAQAGRQTSARQVNDVCDVVQKLTKSIGPLGKLLDCIPEDFDAMQLELTMWRDTYNQASTELKREQSLTASATEPLKHQLQQIQASIAEYRELIDETRHKILQNNARIQKMMMEQ
ncbi:TRAF3-interacting protein 1 isoform X2 [Drosophila yakuba]|uniref:TRAF3-interacting protein 1 isoform X2 n=1 Tax=Drosophila yakuba TaxID=7245 RepID=UPI00017DCDF4|nr:TRAF3-interacting protein 1 isoform X2 [Drosophila yakuba]